MADAERMTTDNAQMVKKTFTVEFVLPFNNEAKPESMHDASAIRAIGDFSIIATVSPDLVNVTDVTTRLLEGDEATASVDFYNKVLDDLKAQREIYKEFMDVLTEVFGDDFSIMSF